ncbi:hypothetical protein EI067_30195 [Mycobacterium paragordonae]|nr:hypothetical protein EI067_30195 [Mycobacterium paragordonae]
MKLRPINEVGKPTRPLKPLKPPPPPPPPNEGNEPIPDSIDDNPPIPPPPMPRYAVANCRNRNANTRFCSVVTCNWRCIAAKCSSIVATTIRTPAGDDPNGPTAAPAARA